MFKSHFQAVLANIIWGSLPIYFYLIGEYPPLFLLSVQMISTFLALLVFIFSMKSKEIKIKISNLSISLVPSILLTLNWGGYAIAVKSGYVIEASYAYLILPILLLSINLFLGKENDLNKKACILLSLIIIAADCYINGVFPVIGFMIAIPFVGYILWHRKHNLHLIESLFYETLLMLPLGIGLYFYIGGSNIQQVRITDMFGLLILGVLTVIPLALFVNSSKKVSFNILSVYQLISPILGMSIGIFLYDQTLKTHTVIAYCALIFVLIAYNIRILKENRNGLS